MRNTTFQIKKQLTNTLILLLFILLAKTGYSQAVEEGTKTIDIYYGWPNLFTNIAKETLTSHDSESIQVGGFGPVGTRFEYMVSDKIGMGVDFNYASTSLEWKEFNTYDEYGNMQVGQFEFETSIIRWRALLRFNFHFGISDKFDPYWTLGAGYSSFSYKYETNDPYYEDQESDFDFIPVAVRLGVGGRYYLSEHIGIGTEIGIGGPLMTFGGAIKF